MDNETTASRARDEGFSDGVILALQIMTGAGDMGSADYEELLGTAGAAKVYRRAKSEGMLRLSGLSEYLKQKDHAPSMRLRKELGLDA